ncbi:MAG: hypothetical protein NE330_00460 [Lentisphaeraceae bacterium]|nr:hypothetical protein [Lentisphaeraceae bacterium]
MDDLTGKIYATTLASLMLTVYYRYLPSSKGAKGGFTPKNAKKKPEIEEEGLDLIE